MEPSVSLDIHCDDPWFTYIQQGTKKVEGRKGKEIYRALKPGSVVRFHCDNPPREFLAQVDRVDSFVSLEDYLNGVGLENALPSVETMAEGKKIYLQWSSEQEIEEMGFLGIWVSVLSKLPAIKSPASS